MNSIRMLATKVFSLLVSAESAGLKRRASHQKHTRTAARLMLLGILAIGACFLLPGKISAETPLLEVVQVGWDGQVAPGSWSPIRVKVTGGDADIAGRIEAVSKVRVQSGPQANPIEYATGAWGQELALPAGVSKEVTLWVPSSNDVGGNVGSLATVRLLSDGTSVAEAKVEFKSAKTAFWPLIGVLADSPVVARSITQVELPVQGLPMPLSVAKLTVADLPVTAERLNALRALVIQGNAATTLTNEQRVALQQWVAAGGHLVLSGGPDAARAASALPSEAFPVSFSTSDSYADLAGLNQWAEYKGQALTVGPAMRFRAEKGTAIAGTAEAPLAWRFGLGQGTVTVLAVDPGLEPLASWPGAPALFHKALEPALPVANELNEKYQYIQMQQRNPVNLFQNVIEALPAEAWPQWQLLALLLGGFVLVVGPGLHLVLWRTDKRIWSWIIVPVAAVLLVGSMYYLGVGRDGRDVLVNVVSYVTINPDGGQAKQALMAGYFAPTHSTLTVDVPGDSPIQPSSNSGYQTYRMMNGSASTSSNEPPFHVITGRDTRVEFTAGQWGMRNVALERWVEKPGRISADLRLEGGLIQGSLRNETPYPLEDAAVLVGQSAVKLGSLAPGQTVPVTLDPGTLGSPFGNNYPISWRIFGKPRAGSSSAASVAVAVPAAVSLSSRSYVSMGGMQDQLEVPQDAETQRRLRLMDPIVNVPQMGPSSQSMPLTFFAFTEVPVGGTLPSAGDHPVYYLTLVQQALTLEMLPGPFTIPAALTPPEMSMQNGNYGGGGNGTISWIQLQGGTLGFEFRPPLPAKSAVTTLLVSTRQIGQAQTANPSSMKGMASPAANATPGPAEAGIFSVYNWQSAKWDPLPGGTEEARLQPASAYISSDGVVKVQVASGTDRMVAFLQPELTVEGTVGE